MTSTYHIAIPQGLGFAARWYSAHRAAGGAPDHVAEDLLSEVRAEDAAGQPYSHQPGRA